MILPLYLEWFYSHVRARFSDLGYTYHLMNGLGDRVIHLEFDESETVLLCRS
jgi:hypothetical protein